MLLKIIILTLSVLILSCHTKKIKTEKDMVYHIASVNNNVCKKLIGNVVLYAIFVDSKYTGIWTEYDINSTIDSIKLASNWIEHEAKKNGITLSIQLDYHSNNNIIPIEANLTRKTLSATVLGVNGIKLLDTWADKIAKEATKTYGLDTSIITKNKITPKGRENLIARLKNIHQTDNIAILYFINNSHTDEISVVLHASEDINPEYGVVSYKNPGTIAHEFLHLFGAKDLYRSPFDKNKKTKKQMAFAMKEFPNEIMAFSYRSIDSLEISSFSRYLIGWESKLDEKYKNMLVGKKIKIANY
jgi:hypothetical protein